MVMWLHAPTPYTLAAAADMYSKTKSKTTQVHKVHALGAFRENKNAKLAVQAAIREIFVPRKLELIYIYAVGKHKVAKFRVLIKQNGCLCFA